MRTAINRRTFIGSAAGIPSLLPGAEPAPNLLGEPANRARYRSQADEMKDRLLAWLGRAGSPLAAGVRERKFA